MGVEAKAAELGLTFPEQEPGYLNLCVRTGNLLITSGHTSDIKGKLGADLTEPPRDFRRLHFLRGWGHGKTKQILTRG